MKILVVSAYWPTKSNKISGIFVVQQVAALVRSGCHVTVIVSKTVRVGTAQYCSVAELGLSVQFVRLLVISILKLPDKLSFLPGAIWQNTAIAGLAVSKGIRRQLRYEMVPFAGCIIHGERYMGLAVPLWRRYINGSVCQVVHGVDPFLTQVSNKNRARDLFRVAGRECNAVILVGRPLSSYAASIGLPDDRIHIVANGTDLPLLATVSDAQRTLDVPRQVVSVSNLIELKGIADNLRALAQIAIRRPDLAWEYQVVGDGIERPHLETLAQDLGIAEKVHFLGRIPYDETMRQVAEADIFSLPSWGEAFGIVYLEAMARMRPVIGCLANGPEDILTHDHDGLLVTPHSVAELSDALERLIGSPELCRKLGCNARTTAEGYSWDRNVRRMLELLRIEI